MANRKRFDGRVVLLTGSGGGQGRVAALRFARESAVVVGCDVNAEGHEGTRALLAAEGLVLHGDAPVDLGDAAQAERWVKRAAQAHGRIDVLYNNASAARFGPVGELSVEDWRYTMRNEIDLVFYTTRHAWKHLAVRGGVVLNISSVAAWGGTEAAGICAHAAAKGAVVSFTRQIAVEGAKLGIRAVSISPGFIATPGTEAFMANPVARAAILDGVLLDRPGESDEVVSTALFLASDEASFITGTDVVVDGGLLAR